jgi:hypothetical protein
MPWLRNEMHSDNDAVVAGTSLCARDRESERVVLRFEDSEVLDLNFYIYMLS